MATISIETASESYQTFQFEAYGVPATSERLSLAAFGTMGFEATATGRLEPRLGARDRYGFEATATGRLEPRLGARARYEFEAVGVSNLHLNLKAAFVGLFKTKFTHSVTRAMRARDVPFVFGGAGTVAPQGVTVRDIARQVLSTWRLVNFEQAQPDMRERCMSDINATFQLIYSRARNLGYFNRQTLNVTIPDGQSSVDLDEGIQVVLGTVRLTDDDTLLSPAGSLAELKGFSEMFLGDSDVGGTPLVYFIDSRNDAAAFDNAKATLHVAPGPVDGDTAISLEAALQAPRYTWTDVLKAKRVRLPHVYVETLVVPIARKRASSFFLFRPNDGQLQSIEAEYQKAMETLGLVDPADDAATSKPTREAAVKT